MNMASYRVTTINDVKFFEAPTASDARERAQQFLANGDDKEVVLEQETSADQWSHVATMRRAEAAE